MLRAAIAVLCDRRAIANLEYALLAGLLFSALLNAAHVFVPKLSSSFSHLGDSVVARDKGT